MRTTKQQLGRATSMLRLRRFWWGWRRIGISRWYSSVRPTGSSSSPLPPLAATFAAHFRAHLLHALPLLGADHNDHLRHKYIVLHGAAREEMVADLNVHHGDRIAAFSERGLLVQLQRLRHFVRTQHRKLGRVDRVYFAGDEVLAQRSTLLEASPAATGAARPASSIRAIGTVHRPRSHRLSGPRVIGIFLTAHDDNVPHLEISTLGGLTIFLEFGLGAGFHRDGVPIGIEDFQRTVMHGGDLAEKRQALAVRTLLSPWRRVLSRRGQGHTWSGRGNKPDDRHSQNETHPQDQGQPHNV